MKVRAVAWLLATVGLVSAAGVQASYSNLVVFGDSLSDSGNNALAIGTDPSQVITGNSYVPTFPYASGNYTNGSTWAQLLAGKMSLSLAPSLAGGTDFAYGGAQTSYENPDTGGFPPSLTTQVNQYLGVTGGTASADALYVIAGGGNNARSALQAISEGAKAGATIRAAAKQYAIDTGNMVDALQAAGAQHIVVWNTPNVGLTPAVLSAGRAAKTLGSRVTSSMNARLDARMAGEAGVTVFDLYGLQTNWVADPAAYGFVNVTDACGALPACDPSTYLFWDGIHPTSAGHALVADAMYALDAPSDVVTTSVPEPATYATLLAGLALLTLARRRSARAVDGR